MGSQRTELNEPLMTQAYAGLPLGSAAAPSARSTVRSALVEGGRLAGARPDCQAPAWRPKASQAVALTVVAVAFAWSYWPTLGELVRTWAREPDYSHGFFVVPLACLFLWLRRDCRPEPSPTLAWGGLALILMSIAARFAGALFYIDSVDAWSIPLWVGGAAWLFWGRHLAQWAAPAIAFLWFMAPLPWRVERWLSLPLQGIATRMSTWTLQSLGQPALAEGHTILLGNYRLEIVEACSGLRVFVGIFAMAFAYVICMRRAWWERGLLLLSALPVALAANAARIVVTGVLYQYVSGEAAHRFSHDISGWFSIPFAAVLFAGVLAYLDHLLRREAPTGRRRSSTDLCSGSGANTAAAPRWRMVNVSLLLGTLVAGAVLAPAAYAWHGSQVERVAATFMAQAETFEQQADWERAADYYHRYLRLEPHRVDARVALARAYDRSAAGDAQRKGRAAALYEEAIDAAGGAIDSDELESLRARRTALLRELAINNQPPATGNQQR